MKKTEKKLWKLWQKVLLVIILIPCVLVISYGLIVIYLSVTEYRPADQEKVEITGTADRTLTAGSALKVMTWNVGYGALGDNADFFMDGGSHVYTADRERVQENLAGIEKEIASVSPDVCFMQEVDRNSDRSRHIDEVQQIADSASGYQSTFAWNFRTEFIPYPWLPIGKVNGGILTLSAFGVSASQRLQLPCPFSWPVRLAQLKRCVMVDRVPVKGSDHELVLVNLHLEAYDDGEGKKAQTAILREILQKEADAGNYVIAGGDFNQTFSNTDISAYPAQEGKWHAGAIDTADFGDSWQMLMDSRTPSCRSLDQPYAGADTENFQYYVIDGFIVSSNIQVDSCQTQSLSFRNTDHNPVVLDVTLK